MSDSDEENYCFFGKPLEPYDENAFPKKKPISVEDQVAKDAQGRRRFHGAFTGGFSAGFYNTVGSLEGWTPTEFKSTRQEKALNKTQRPEDFMDDEDMGEFGIAPQTVRATSDYSTSKKRKKQVFSDGPIPGEPVLHSLLTSGNETIGYLLLKNIGLKGKDTEQSTDKVYGCEMPKTYEISRDEDVQQYKIADIYQEYLQKPKDNTFGLGYVGLDKSHVNLFQSAKLEIRERNNKKLSISGQAFGVGAFEDDDEDIYVKDDMTRYDFELTSEKTSKKDTLPRSEKVFDDFVASKTTLTLKEVFLPPNIPHSFTGKHKVKKSRFEPVPEPKAVERKDMNAEVRARCLGEETVVTETKKDLPEEKPKEAKNIFSVSATNLVFDRFVSASKPEDPSNILEVVERAETEHGTQEMRAAAKMKMFGPLTRLTEDWQPCSLLCKRFNVPEPHADELNANKTRKRTKNLIFEYEKCSDVSESHFQAGLSVQQPKNAAKEPESQPSEERVLETEKTNLEISDPSANKETDNEAPKDITEKIDVNKNMDLFKAVFLSSSEDEEETEKEKTDKVTEMKSSILSEPLIPKIKPIKEGILSNVDFSLFEAPIKPTKPVEESVKAQEDSYGPALPSNLPTASSKSHSYQKEEDCDEWVEKDESSKKHKKKHKNKKSSHKKKHKHSRD